MSLFTHPARALLLALTLCGYSQAGPLRDLLQSAKPDQQLARELPQGSQIQRNLAYGNAERQRFDVYLPPHTRHAPIIFMVHGGGWDRGDKAMAAVVDSKARHWLSKGYVLVSSNYRLLPDANPLEQARDVGRALAEVQRLAPSWGADPGRVVLMGHSAGAHLVLMLSSDLSLSAGVVTTPWLGTVALDSAAFDIRPIMEKFHLPLYDRAFGEDTALWHSASPLQALSAASKPVLAVCSLRNDEICKQADAFAAKATSLGVSVQVLRKDLSHRQINQHLGDDPAYTAEVDAFLTTLGLP